MSDDNLDDFFAKKDKSKKKSKKSKNKEATTDENVSASAKKASSTNESKKKAKESDKEKPEKLMSVEVYTKDDNDWNDYKEEEPDLSGLKIQNLQITKEEEDVEDADVDNEGEEGDVKGEPGVWAAGQSKNELPADHFTADMISKDDVEEKKPKPAAAAPAAPSKYISPGMRDTAAVSDRMNGSGGRYGRKSKIAPNLESQSDFPTLGAEPAPVNNTWGAQSNTRDAGPALYKPPRPQVDTRNSFDILR